MILGIVGSRKLIGSINAYKIIQAYVESFTPEAIISGGAIGIDNMAAEVALAFGYVEGETLVIHLPKPKGEGRGAYIRALFERNSWIVRDSTHILAVTIVGGSSGTTDTINKAISAGKSVYVQEVPNAT